MSNLSMLRVAMLGDANQLQSHFTPPDSDREATKIGSMLRSFQDPWEYQAFFRGANIKALVTATGKYQSALTRIDLHRLWMQRSETSLPHIMHLTNTSDRCAIGFVADPEQASSYHNGIEFLPDMIVVAAVASDHHCRARGASRFAMMSLQPEDLAAASHALIGRELTAPVRTRHIRVSDPSMVRLRQLHDAACSLAADAPDILAHPEVAKAMEQELIQAMVGCLAEAPTTERKTGSHLRMPVMQRFERAIGEAEGQPLYLTEVCARIGVQERTLRNHCLEYLGISPHRYLWLRRMHQARRALSFADPTKKTVTTIANDHGFWELGRFSVAYRKLFGETPSTTLQKTVECMHVAVAPADAQTSGLPILP
jgi:AraC-like DNA-binding protein